VAVKVGVKVAVLLGVKVVVNVGVNVVVCVDVLVGVGVKVGVQVPVKLGVAVGVNVDVNVVVYVDVLVGVDVAAATWCWFPVTKAPVTIAVCPVVCPEALIQLKSAWFWKVLPVIPPTFRSNTSINVCGAPFPSVTKPLRLVNVTAPELSNVRPPCTNVWLAGP
jgi:hypothetical protein